MNSGARNNGRARQRRPWSRPRRPAGAKALAAAKTFHAPLAGRGEDNNHQPRPGQTPERPELDGDVPDSR